MQKKIGPFSLYTKTPNDITCGHLYTMDVVLPVPNCKKRTVRVYLPEGYSEEKLYPVLYMLDGQNIVDKYTTAYGAWDIDVRQSELVKEGYPPLIVVGIDCPKVGHIYRVQEYTFNDVKIMRKYAGNHHGKEPYSNAYMAYVVNDLMPIINQYFSTRREKEFTGIGGSSMGGIASFNFFTSYKDVFGFSLCFSPAFHLYDKKELYKYVDSLNINPNEMGKIYFYTGDVDFEHLFLKPTTEMYNYFKQHGFNNEQAALLVDSTKSHCEAAWSEHFNEAIRFWFNNL